MIRKLLLLFSLAAVSVFPQDAQKIFWSMNTPSGGGVGTWTLIQQTPATSGNCENHISNSSTFTCTMPGNITAGNRLYLGFSFFAGGPYPDVVSITGCSGSWSRLAISNTSSDDELWLCSSATGGSNSVTVGISSSAAFYAGNVSEWTGGTPTLDQTNSDQAINTSATTGSITTTVAKELIMTVVTNGNAANSSGPTAGFIALNSYSPTNAEFAYQVVSSTGTFSNTYGLVGTSGWDAVIASIY